MVCTLCSKIHIVSYADLLVGSHIHGFDGVSVEA